MTSFRGFCGEIMHKSINLLVLKHEFKQKLLNLWHLLIDIH